MFGLGRPQALLLAATAGVLGLSGTARATFPPGYDFRSLKTERVTIHFHQGLEELARQSAALADEFLQRHERRYGIKIGRVHIVLADSEDDPNGFSTPLPFPIVSLRAAAPDGSDDFGNLESWMRMLLSHELAHSVHLEMSGGLVAAGRKIFGRAPFLFPNAATPPWLVEGLATYEETRNTAFGRGRDASFRMIRRMAALEGRFPGEDRATTGLDLWPGGAAPYVFGEGFAHYLADRYGEEVLPLLARTHAKMPVPFLDEVTAHSVTRSSFHALWKEFRQVETARARRFAEERREQGLTSSCALTRRGLRQMSAVFSPDGRHLAFTSSSLTRRREIRVLSLEDGRERRVTDRAGGTTLSWTPDGRRLVYDESEVYRLFESRHDLRAVEVTTGRVRTLTRGLRARDPEVSPDGRQIVFVHRYADRSELALVGIDGREARDLTASAAGTQWSGPAWSPDGGSLVAARWTDGGALDLVRMDADGGGLQELTSDRAADVEPAWTPDGSHVVFRSDRDGASNLYAWRAADGVVLRVTNVLGGAFAPAVAPDGRTLVFSNYEAAGYDLHQMEVASWADLAPAPAFEDRLPPAAPSPAPAVGEARPYRPYPAALPRFWSPYFTRSGEGFRVGVATAGADPLLRHAWGAQAYRGVESGRFGGSGFYVYSRYRPQLVVVLEDNVDDDRAPTVRERKATIGVSVPLLRRRRLSHDVSLSWRRSRQEIVQNGADTLDLGGLEAAWSLTRDVQRFPFSISPSQGERLVLAAIKEDEVFGSQVSLVKALGDARAYRRVFGETDVLALRLGGGTTFGRRGFRRSYAVGGFPEGSLSDIVETNASVLRGFPASAFTGREFVHGNVEYRFPIAHPQWGVWSLPVFARHLHGTVFADVGNAWNGKFRMRDLKTSAGAAIGVDLYIAHGLPFTATAGVARGFSAGRETQRYLRMGLAF
jgi:hypothetical protein